MLRTDKFKDVDYLPMLNCLVTFEIAWGIPTGLSEAASEILSVMHILYHICQPHTDILRDALWL